MADRRPDEQSAAHPPPASPPTSQPRPQQSSQQPSQPEVDLTERINQAYASSAPIVPDEPGDPKGGRPAGPAGPAQQRPSGADRFAAVLAATSGRMKENASSTAGTSAAPPPSHAASGRKPAKTKTASRPAPRVRKARLRLTHVDPWSVMKTAFLLSIALGIVTVVAVAIVWSVLGAADVWGSIDKSVNDVLGDTSNPFRIEEYVGMSRVMGFTLIVAVADVILVTVIATLAAFLYNLAAALLGGLEVVLAEEDR
jgi:Transmembrane domain of unknown function (DUF3566)